MAWVKLDDKRALNQKLRKAGFEARGLDEAAICWSAHEESDGFISDDDLTMLGTLHGCKRTQALADKLVEVERWARNDDRGGYDIQGFLEFNPSRAELEAQRKRDRERKRSRAGIQPESAGNPDGGEPEPIGQVPGYSPTVPTDRPTDEENPPTPTADAVGEPGEISVELTLRATDGGPPITDPIAVDLGQAVVIPPPANSRAHGTNPRAKAEAAKATEAAMAEKRALEERHARALELAAEFEQNPDPFDINAEALRRWPHDPELRRLAKASWTDRREAWVHRVEPEVAAG